MSTKKESATILGVGVAACAVCCAGPILGVLAAIGLGTVAGFALFGAIALLVGAALTALVVTRRRRRAVACASSEGFRTGNGRAHRQPPALRSMPVVPTDRRVPKAEHVGDCC